LEVEKHHFILIIGTHVNKYIFRPNIHQNGPEILGVKTNLDMEWLEINGDKGMGLLIINEVRGWGGRDERGMA
jgi:hypothetical protein